MASDDKKLVHLQSNQDAQEQSGSSSAIEKSSGNDPFFRQHSGLPGNRPIADNDVEDTDEMLGYLD